MTSPGRTSIVLTTCIALSLGLVACKGSDSQSRGDATDGDVPADASDAEVTAETGPPEDVATETGPPDTSDPDVAPDALAIATSTLPEGQAGADYGPVMLEAQGGVPPYAWALADAGAPRADFLDPATGALSGLLGVPGSYELAVTVSDAEGDTAQRTLTLMVQSPEAFDSATGAAIGAGERWFGDFVVRAGDTVTLDAGTILNVPGRISIEAGGRVEVSDCGALTINHLSRAEAQILGEVDNRCPEESEPGGDLIIRTTGDLYLGSDGDGEPGLVASSGELFIGDPFYAPRPEPEVLTYVATVEPDAVPPVCAVRAAVLPDAEPTFPFEVTLEAVHHDPDGGATSVASVDWGDGTVDEAPAALVHGYAEPGLNEVLVTVLDDEGSECTATLMLFFADPPVDEEMPEAVSSFAGPPSLWVAPDPFEGEALVQPVGVPGMFTSERSDPDAAAAWYLDGERLDCPAGDTQCVAAAAASAPGIHEVVLTAESLDGELTTARMTIYAPLEGGETERADPPAPDVPFPPLPPTWQAELEAGAGPDARTNPKSHGTTCADCALCDDPMGVAAPVALLGNTELRAWGQGGAIIVGFSTATVVISPALMFSSTAGAAGGPGEDGKSARGFGAASYSGRIVLCGGSFTGARGGDGGTAPGPNPNSVVRGGRGAPWFGVLFSAPEGSISYCGPMTVTGADGGNGGHGINDVSGAPGAACRRADSATAIGGRGGLGGGGIAYLAEDVCFDDGYAITFDCALGACLGGIGGDGIATGQTPAPCNNCDQYAGRGGDARSVGGKGGRSVWYFVTRPDLAPDPEVYRDHLFVTGTYLGGDGGVGDSIAGDGGDSTCNGCSVEYSWAGRGGHAYATGGRGSFGLSGRGAGGNVLSDSGHGGDATSTPNPMKGNNGCPGARGCTLYGFGGRSGIARGWPGAGSPDGTRTLTSGVGGDATVTGGDGGDGVGCPKCNGGRGGKAVAIAGRDTQGLPFRLDGTATATGGMGGTGSTCCTPPEEGGSGGRGGDGISRTGPAGANANRGGNGGAGGDGEPPGGGGAKGLGIGTPVAIPDGVKGPGGGPCPGPGDCPDPGPDCCNVPADCGVPPQCTEYDCVDHGCISIPLTGDPCDDGDVCTDEDHCDDGLCVGTPADDCCMEDIDCLDVDPCTDDKCVDFRCTHPPAPDETPCDDGDLCTEPDQCAGGECVGGPVITCSDDGNECTADVCNEETGNCHDPVPDGTECDDDDECTSPDRCQEGTCVGELGGDPCDFDEDCDDSDPCTIDDCGDCGECTYEAVDCDDDIACTVDSCVADNDTPVCEHQAVHAACGEGDECVTPVCDVEEGCVSVVTDCDDEDVCTVDDCNPASGCTHQPITCPAAPVCQVSVCDAADGCGTINEDDGTPCGSNMICSGGECVPRLALVTEDCWIAVTPGQSVDVTTWVSGGAGTTTVSLSGGSPGYNVSFKVSGTTLQVGATSPEGHGGEVVVRVRIQRGAEVVEILAVASFAAPAGSQGAILTETDGDGPTSKIDGVVELSSDAGDSVEAFISGEGAGWVCDGNSCAWCWASSLQVSSTISNLALGSVCNPECGAGQECIVQAGVPTCLSTDAAQTSACVAAGTGNLYLSGPGCVWRSLSSHPLYIDDPPATTGNQVVDVGAPLTLGPIPEQAACGFLAFRYEFTASPPLDCVQRLQAGGPGVLGREVVVIFQ